MKKFLAIMIVAVMAAALCVSASALYALDRIGINSNKIENSVEANKTSYTIRKGDKMYILGWAIGEPGTGLAADEVNTLICVCYHINDSDEAVLCNEGTYIDRTTDLGPAFNGAGYIDAQYKKAGFGANDDMLELKDIDKLEPGTYKITLYAFYTPFNGETFSGTETPDGGKASIGVFTLNVLEEGAEIPNPTTGDAAVVAVAAIAAIALAGVVIGKKALKK